MNIVQNRNKYALLSLSIIIIGLGFMVFNAVNGKGMFNYDVEFSGGTSMLIDIGGEFQNTEIEDIVIQNSTETSPQIQRILGTTQVTIKIKSLDEDTRETIKGAFKEKYSIKDEDISIDYFSPTISSEMKSDAILALLVTCIGMLIYITFRFKDFKIGASAVMTLLHDSLIVVSVYAILRIPLNYSFIAVMLTILGYSINATIVIFDRIRENRRILQTDDKVTLINTSVKQSITRSINTSFSTLLTIVFLYILGVNSIKEFSLPIIIGIIFGTYSSVFLSGSFWYVISNRNSVSS